jgi:copper(I)-binding protein
MLMEPVAPLAPGDPVVLELRMADGEVLRTTARVRADGGMADDHHHHHHDH